MTVLGYILIHHSSMEKLFNKSDTTTDNDVNQLHHMLVVLFDTFDVAVEDFVLLSSIVTGLRYYTTTYQIIILILLNQEYVYYPSYPLRGLLL